MPKYFAGSPGRRRQCKVERSRPPADLLQVAKWRKHPQKEGQSGATRSKGIRTVAEISEDPGGKVEGAATISHEKIILWPQPKTRQVRIDALISKPSIGER